ncbi:hypothetical protein ASPACDRAFT_126370 [Aspergillus aculeatus ATCC 16872]|uniref:Yeast cell wall synthesis Kre9/Knh1-like N-terminal domain-containing protein n=1 Tax=Aspergillus aculeatus (strain ATCC 16872 / CBS 172.66 / WB 5094) TaxID=690307 RepID=A0A1L9WHD2_ASPA1|nr:uncharacterized protein ASPACDRAFT_126370 [Aspergillus aculeatus ATCC 16872]OJJ95570.1 hypothetical protein ASPACDRAFT_126370 [Aspergillus aculeatus ATCC 16872]
MFFPPKHILPLLTTLTTFTTLTTASPDQKPAYRITSPAASAILTPNTPSVISWSTTQRSSAKLSIHLETTTNHTNLYTIATNITNSGSISWSPPARIPPGEEYIIVLDPTTSPDNDTNTTNTTSTSNTTQEAKPTYKSPAFTITAPDPSSKNSTTTTSETTTYYPTENQAIARGKTTIVTWPVAQDQKSGHVSIYLMEGREAESTTAKNVSTVATHVANSGSLACVLPGNLTLAEDYRFAVVGVDGGEEVKYSAMFRVVDGDEGEEDGDDDGRDEVEDVQEKNEEEEGGEAHAAETSATPTESGLASSSTGALQSDSTWIATAGAARLLTGGGWVGFGMVVAALLV